MTTFRTKDRRQQVVTQKQAVHERFHELGHEIASHKQVNIVPVFVTRNHDRQ